MKVRYIGRSNEFYCINGRIYDMVGESNGYWRIVDESGEDYLYDPKVFEIVGGENEQETDRPRKTENI